MATLLGLRQAGLALAVLWGSSLARAEDEPSASPSDVAVGDRPASTRSVGPARVEAEGLFVEFGRGVRITNADSPFVLTLRGRVQTRAMVRNPGVAGDDLDVNFLVRRARLVLLGDLDDRHLQFYLQLGFAADDVDRELLLPLRDAVITWSRLRDLSIRFGQMKVNFSRERMISSSSLQLVDRSVINAELNLDRDVGVQIFSNDLFGLNERLGYQIGVYGGDGRNRMLPGSGVLVSGRLWVNPFGEFDDLLLEADLLRSKKPRLSFGIAAAMNGQTTRLRSTHGSTLITPVDTRHAAADLLFKIAGFSVQTEALWRDVKISTDHEGPRPLAGGGAFVQAGYVFPIRVELSGRWAEFIPMGLDAGRAGRREITGGLGWYVQRHDLKVQTDYTWGRGALFVGSEDRSDHLAQTQVQVFF